MLRLAPTSISLSENDLQHHLRQVSVYEGLLNQGFKKKDIIRYYVENAKGTRQNEHERSATVVEMVTARRAVPDESQVDTASSAQSLPVQDTAVGARQHAPRQNSLLRFARTISYRPRSETEAYIQSEADSTLEDFSRLALGSSPGDTEEAHTGHLSDSSETVFTPGIETKAPVLSPLRPQAPVFRPALPPPFSATSRASSSQSSLPAGSRSSTPINPNYEVHSRSTASLPISTPPRISSLSSMVPAASPASPEPSSSPYHFSPHSPSSMLLPMPVTRTPTPILPTPTPRSEPRNFRSQNFDGTSFDVYNDSLSASTQPQTPADLSRRPLLTEHEAAYTAPPGRVLAVHRYRSEVPATADAGEQSPTVRAISIRERRNRESFRSVRVESRRWARMREEEAGRLREFPLNGPGPAFRDGWRDDLDADRVGEENFEDTAGGLARTIRIVSGARVVHTQR